MNKTKNDEAWESLFEKYKILEEIEEHNLYNIEAKKIKEFREPRLMAKIDYKSQLPNIFSENDLAILPISKGGYMISKFNIFKDFEQGSNSDITKYNFPSYLESIDYNDITSESAALNCAYISGITQDFVEDEHLKLTVSGRMKSDSFSFDINGSTPNFNMSVSNAQIEIDGGYEGEKFLSIIEAKNSISQDFLIRQLYYPYRLWSNKINKKIKTIFLTYSNGIFHFREYEFKEPNHYNSLELIKDKRYQIQDDSLCINMEFIQNTLNNVKITEDPNIPFPQADSFERVINLCELLNEYGCLKKEAIVNNYDFVERQSDYYTNAGIYLGLIDKREGETVYSLTKIGKQLFQVSIIKRQAMFIESILSHRVFNKTLTLYLNKDSTPNKQEIVSIMKESNLYKVRTEKTFQRRASTILSWIEWILEQREE